MSVEKNDVWSRGVGFEIGRMEWRCRFRNRNSEVWNGGVGLEIGRPEWRCRFRNRMYGVGVSDLKSDVWNGGVGLEIGILRYGMEVSAHKYALGDAAGWLNIGRLVCGKRV